jgi:hypothetical protein
MLNPYGSSAVLAMWQGFVNHPNVSPDDDLTTRTAYGNVFTRIAIGVFLIQLSTGADDATMLCSVQLFNQNAGNNVYLSQILYNPSGSPKPPGNQQIQLTFMDIGHEKADPPDLFNFVISDVNDSIDESPGNP